jgi:hypothetical protein
VLDGFVAGEEIEGFSFMDDDTGLHVPFMDDDSVLCSSFMGERAVEAPDEGPEGMGGALCLSKGLEAIRVRVRVRIMIRGER